jgi:DNA polymerase-3 subunit epsilon
MGLRPIYYDTETTGIKAEKDRIIEIAAYDPVLNRSFDQLINPGCPIPSEAMAIHHISNEMVENAPPFSEVGKQFAEFCSGDVVLIAHNNDNFDLLFLQQEFKRSSLQMPSWMFLDTLKWARRYRPDLPRHTLQFLREIYGIPANKAHRALDDVVVLHQMFTYMIDDLQIEDVVSLLTTTKSY